MKSFIFVTLALICVSSKVFAGITQQIGAIGGKVKSSPGHGNTGKAADMIYIGTVEGKSYYTDYTNAYVSWMGAAEFCNSNGLNIATIETAAQDLLIYEEASSHASVWFWLTAYRFFDDNVFYWLPNQSPFKYTGWQDGFPIPSLYNCMYAGATGTSTNKGWFNNLPCEAQQDNIFPLCESR